MVEILLLGTKEGSCRNLDYFLFLITVLILEMRSYREVHFLYFVNLGLYLRTSTLRKICGDFGIPKVVN